MKLEESVTYSTDELAEMYRRTQFSDRTGWVGDWPLCLDEAPIIFGSEALRARGEGEENYRLFHIDALRAFDVVVAYIKKNAESMTVSPDADDASVVEAMLEKVFAERLALELVDENVKEQIAEQLEGVIARIHADD
ncbi:hypothetical protein HZD78_21870 [Mycobacteroides chelonae]|uniref:hypothetical protein n=1 Tax=Mycobacteroides TaxID=670516 RepID=UPI000E6A327E|nr:MULTISPECIES: hypothetical protein [Mycobacteroides]MBN7314510.1 hypothetical protein [Mycobacteroides abscessus subsp. abscessus]MBV6362597.1 hypothetical protein [Mycobacteroides chelonae]RIU14695.1 hypothetical protein D2F01_01730 [Mycobacteroides abscessus]